METLQSVLLMLLALSILIVIHEFGHFWAARMFKIKVEKFFLFFDYKFKLFSFKRGDTEYGIGWIPLGGYVKIAGMLDESMDEEQLKAPMQPWEFRSKPIWQRLIVMLGGIIMNVILGCLIFIALKFIYGDKYTMMDRMQEGIHVSDSSYLYKYGFRNGDKILSYNDVSYPYLEDYGNPNNLIDSRKEFEVEHRDGKKERITLADSTLAEFRNLGRRTLFDPLIQTKIIARSIEDSTELADKEGEAIPFALCNAYRQGLRTGDQILKLDSTPVAYFHEVHAYLKQHPTSPVTFHVMRGEKVLDFAITPHDSLFGVGADDEYLKQKFEYGFFESMGVGTKAAFTEAWNNVKGLKAMASGRVNASKSVSGPIGIAGIYGKSFQQAGWLSFWTLTAMLSMVLAVMNLLPIPVLDGGHVVILCIEGIIGRELPMKLKEIIMMIGFAIVALLMIFIIGNDIIKLF